jgi:hypothetical protein
MPRSSQRYLVLFRPAPSLILTQAICDHTCLHCLGQVPGFRRCLFSQPCAKPCPPLLLPAYQLYMALPPPLLLFPLALAVCCCAVALFCVLSCKLSYCYSVDCDSFPVHASYPRSLCRANITTLQLGTAGLHADCTTLAPCTTFSVQLQSFPT